MKNQILSELISITQVAKMLGVSTMTVRRWENNGLLISFRPTPTSQRRYKREEILTLIDSKDIFDDHVKMLEKCDNAEIGTKAKNLKIVAQETKYSVPKTLMLTTKLYQELIKFNKIKDPSTFDWQNKFLIPKKWEARIVQKIKSQFGERPVVIRSSATCEDSPLLSFAGQYSTFLNITNPHDILVAIRLCYASLFSENAKIYAKYHNVKLQYESMAIAIQEVAPVKVSGVMFTVDPITKDKNKVIIEHSKGLGDKIVSGHVIPTHIEVLKNQSNESLSSLVNSLLKIAKILEGVFGCPQDIEWGFDGKEFYIFQSRPITTLNKQPNIASFDTNNDWKVIGTGDVACFGKIRGRLKIVSSPRQYNQIKKGDIVLTDSKIDISIVAKLENIAGLIISGDVLSHIAVIAREFNKPCLIKPASLQLEDYSGKKICLDTSQGKVFLIQ